jgi:hypothetical protein
LTTRKLGASTVVAALLGTTALAAGTAAPALADSSKILPIKSVGDVVVDGVHQRVLISDPAGDKIVATTYDGTVVASHPVNNPTTLALSADSGQLYATSPDGLAIFALDTGTLAQTAKYPTGGVTPFDVAVAGGKLWFTYSGNLGSVDLSAETPAAALAQGGTGWQGSAELASAAADVNRLGIAAYDRISILDVADGTAKTVATTDTFDPIADMAISPDGTTIATVTPGDYVVTLRDAEDLGAKRTLPIEAYPEAVDIATDGTIVGGSFSWYSPDLHIFTPDGTAMVRQYDFPNTGNSSGADELQQRGVAFEPDGTRLFAISKNTFDAFSLRTYTEPKKSLPALKLAGPAKATRAKPLTVTGTLTASVPLPAGTPVTVTRTDLESPSGKALGTRTTGTNGTFTITDTPPAGGKVTYRASYAGDANHSAVAASKAIEVSRTAVTLSLKRPGAAVKYGATVSVTATLGKTYKNKTVEIWADPYGSDQKRRLVKRGTVNSKGNLSASLKLTRNTTFTATFAGDARTAAKTVSGVVSTKTKVSLTLAKHYKTAKIGSTKYKYFHKKTAARFTSTLPVYGKRKVYMQVQYYSGGKWRTWGTGYFSTSGGRAVASLDGSHDVGVKLRVRAGYRKGGSGDTINATTYTSYSYFIFK